MNLNIHWMPTNRLNATQIRPCASWAQQSFESMLCTSNLKKQSRHQQLDVDAKQQQHLAQHLVVYNTSSSYPALVPQFSDVEARPETLHLITVGGYKLATLFGDVTCKPAT